MFKLMMLSAALALPGSAALGWERITTEAQYRERVAGRQISMGDQGHVTFAADGSASGTWGGAPLIGAWTWSDGYHCRNLRIGNNETGTDCHLIELQGDQLRATAGRGSGRVTIGTLR